MDETIESTGYQSPLEAWVVRQLYGRSLKSKQLYARSGEGANIIDEALGALRDRGVIACANGRWYLRERS